MSPPNSVGDSDAVNSLLAHVLNEQGICPYVLLTFVQNLSNMDMGGPMQRMHSWLVRARRLGAVALSPKPRGGLQTILPAHLPQCPVPGVPPKSSRSKQNWAAKRAAWCLTEWLVALFGYYELKCPKSLPDISAALGDWYVSDTQHAYILELYEGLIPFCSVKSDEDFSRGRKSLLEIVTRFRFDNV